MISIWTPPFCKVFFSYVQTRKVAVLYPALCAALPLAPMKSADPRLILLTGC